MTRSRMCSVVIVLLIGSAAPASAGPVLWNYTVPTVAFTVYTIRRAHADCETRDFKRGEYTALSCTESTCLVTAEKAPKVKRQRVFYRDGEGVSFDDYGLHVVSPR